MPDTPFSRPSGLFCQTRTSRRASGYGKGLRITALYTLKIAVFAPIPSASVRIAARQKAGCFASVRRVNRTSIPKCYRIFGKNGSSVLQFLGSLVPELSVRLNRGTEEPKNRRTIFLFFFLFLAGLGCLGGSYDFLGLQGWDVVVMIELHVERRTA